MRIPSRCGNASSSPGDLNPIVLDMQPMIGRVCDEVRNGVAAAVIARRFHSTLVEMIAAVCDRLRAISGLDAVVLTGGVFMNALLTTEVLERLEADGFRVYRHRRVPPNDGGLSLGQLAVAAAHGSRSRRRSSDVSRSSREESSRPIASTTC